MNRAVQLVMFSVALYSITACSSVSSVVSVHCSPNTLEINETSQCTASVAKSGFAGTAITWSATHGSISSSGLFTPSALGNAIITATLAATSTLASNPILASSIHVSVVPPPVPSVTNISSTYMLANGATQTITITGSNFQAGDTVQLEWTEGSNSGQWIPISTAPAIVSTNEITVPINPGVVTSTILLQVCNSENVCSNESQSIAAFACVLPSDLPLSPLEYSGSTYHSFGDSITAGYLLPAPQDAYPYLIANDLGFALIDYAIGGSQACDLAPTQIFANKENPSIAGKMLYSVMVGTDDSIRNVTGYTPVFSECYQAAIAWLAVPAEFKVRANGPGVTTHGGGGLETYNNWDSWNTSSEGSSITFPLTVSSARAVYIWARMIDGDTGTYSYSVDGSVVGNSATGPSIDISTNNGVFDSLQLLRIPSVAAGSHTITLTQTSSGGTMRIVGIGVPPDSQQGAPVVLAGDIPYSLNTAITGCSGTATPSLLYMAEVENAVEMLSGDALSITYIPTREYMFGTAIEMGDEVHPNELGHQELSSAFLSGLK